jgi:hypothetical protein
LFYIFARDVNYPDSDLGIKIPSISKKFKNKTDKELNERPAGNGWP